MEVKFLVIQGRPLRKSLVFPHGSYVFGRGAECHIRPNSEWVSRQHCQLLVNDESASIRDLGSRNGTLINGERVMGERELTNGDQLQIGPLVFEVRLEPTPGSTPELLGVTPRSAAVVSAASACLATAPPAHAFSAQDDLTESRTLAITPQGIDIPSAST
jgi:pSer/pThr/pTyr-binding forkhead associated (FHA) protein